MPLTKKQITDLLSLVATTAADDLDCDDCFHDVAAFADAELMSRELPGALVAVENHLKQCPCCEDEYRALLAGLKEIQHA